ncbi:MAG: hypothetical protein N3J91_15820, partial [Verrucomicrobiae bacterium]|nr:hypothetical protein [Verrucomicrobiae bacterium]
MGAWLGAAGWVAAQGQRSVGAQASSCYMYPQFVSPRFIQPEFERRTREKKDFVKPDPYRAEFIKPQFVTPQFVRPQFQPRTYLGCTGNRFEPVENGYKLAMQQYGRVQTNAAPQEAGAQVAAAPVPNSSYHYKPPARAEDCCGGD